MKPMSMNIRLLSGVFIVLLFIHPAYAAQSTITEADGYSCMGDDKSRKQTEQAAMIDAKKNAVEYTSTYVKSETQVKDYALQKDLVSVYANADVKVIEDLDKGWYKDPSSGDCYKIRIKAEVIPDEKAMEKLAQAAAGTNDQANINVPVAPPPVVSMGTSSQQGAAVAPDVVVVPSGETYVYMVPDATGVYFYSGYWYRYYEGYWFRSPNYVANWGMVAPAAVPRVVVNVPPEYPRYLPPAYHRIHYNDLHQHWREWDGNHEWHKHDWYRAEMRLDVIGQRQALINQEREQHRIGMERKRQEAMQQSRHQEQQRIEKARQLQEAQRQSRQQEQQRIKREREHQEAQQRSQKLERNRLKMERQLQMAQHKQQQDRSAKQQAEGKDKKQKKKDKDKKKKAKPKLQQKQEQHK